MTGKPSHAADGLTVLDPRFPIRLYDGPLLFWAYLEQTGNVELVMAETARAAQQDMVAEERFIAAQQAPQPAIEAPAIEAPAVPYPELAEQELAHEWDTMPHTAILEYEAGVEYEPPPPAWPPAPTPQRRGPDGRFIKGCAS
jgi:hypothetical protein